MAYQAMTKPGATLKDFSEAVAKEPLMFQPGTSFTTTAWAFDILGRYLEALTRPAARCHVEGAASSGPLKMPDADFHVPAEKSWSPSASTDGQPSPGVLVPGNDLANAHHPTHALPRRTRPLRHHRRLRAATPAHGPESPAQLGGARVLKPESVDLIFENHLKHPTMKYGLGGIVNGAGSYGWGGSGRHAVRGGPQQNAPSRSSWCRRRTTKRSRIPPSSPRE